MVMITLVLRNMDLLINILINTISYFKKSFNQLAIQCIEVSTGFNAVQLTTKRFEEMMKINEEKSLDPNLIIAIIKVESIV